MDIETRDIILKEILPLVEKGELALFLGAGTSIGTPSINKLTIPSSGDLVKRICEACDYEDEDDTSTDLQTAFGVGQDEIDNLKTSLFQTLFARDPYLGKLIFLDFGGELYLQQTLTTSLKSA
ncbi:hypothetical protein [Enterobacter ludwigii]|uniref:hypothetical protein n=1 Tax=Enterobacter ludwigii TaxID=299767 RepID=UPI00202721F4|nr:hypothetical protein [Enterobacter ludwigii]MCL9631840.1 hypothetical protein [Enterobacter ludwigii]